jgi:hypothetical protein
MEWGGVGGSNSNTSGFSELSSKKWIFPGFGFIKA